jgi:hypothetical protein
MTTTEYGEYTAKELCDAILPPMRWIAKDFMAEGLTLLSARPKAGKTTLAQQLGIAKATGTPFLGRYETVKGAVLYVNVDDPSEGLLQENLRLLGGDHADGLKFMSALPELDNGGLEILDKRLARMGEIDPCQLLILDTLTALRREQSGKNLVLSDYEFIAGIKGLFSRHGCSILLISHSRKDSTGSETVDSIDCHLGTTGLTAAVDAVMLLTGANDIRKVLKAKGRRISPFEVHLELQAEDRSGWVAVDAPVEPEKKKELSSSRTEILDVVRAIGPCWPDAVHKRLGGNINTVRSLLKRMVGAGQLWRNQDGLYISSPPQCCNGATENAPVFNTPDAMVQCCNGATENEPIARNAPIAPATPPTPPATPTEPSDADRILAVIDTEPRSSSAIAALTGIGPYNVDVAVSTLFLRGVIQKQCVNEINYFFVGVPAVDQGDDRSDQPWLN